MTRTALLAALLALAACAKSEEASLVPPQEDDGYNMVDPVTAPLAHETDLAVGEWASTRQEDQPALAFGPPATEPLFSMRCDGGEGLVLQRHGVIVGPGLNMMLVDAGGEARRLAVNPVEGPLPLLRATVQPGNELIGELASARDRISVRIGNSEPLTMPPSPLIGEFVRGCGGESAAAPEQANAAEPAETNQATPSERTPR